ncbi:bone morphogenetic protein 1-like [Amphiura filiformis]|uniref:bone morphogenetic protein 1-like n=1 Tax=Amphiura filiformis TaxID=82378 RepID=UPI003B222518
MVNFVLFGLAMIVTSVNGQCQAVLEVALDEIPTVNISSPNYPRHYDHNLDCYWHFTYPRGQGVTVKFIDFGTELNYDKLFLAPTQGNETIEYHGAREDLQPSIPRTIYLRWRELWVRFQSDGGGSKPGFFIQITAGRGPACAEGIPSCIHQETYMICVDDHRKCDSFVDCDDGSDETDCGLCFDEEANVTVNEVHVITSPGYPIRYPVDLDCSYHVRAPTGFYLVFTIIDFFTEMVYDYLQIQSSPEATHMDALTLFGVSSPDEIYTNSEEIWMTFVSDAWTSYDGFKIELSVTDVTVTKCKGIHWECLNTFLTCFNRRYLCDIDEQCLNGIDQENCAGLPGRGNQVVQLPAGNATILTSPSYPLFYPADIDIQWQLLSPPGTVIRLAFIDFSLVINEDFLYIVSNGSRNSAVTLGSFTGIDGEGKVVLSDGNELWLRFAAGNSMSVTAGMGFVMSLTVEEGCSASEFACRDGGLITCKDAQVQCNFMQECPDASDEGPQCGFCWNPIFNLNSRSSTLTSLFYPYQYPPHLRCFAQISTPSTYGIKLIVTNYMITKQDQLLLSNNYIDETSFDGLNEDGTYISGRVMSVLSFRSDVWLGYVIGANNVTTGFSMEISRYRLGDESAMSCTNEEFECTSAMPSAIVCFNSSVRCDSFADCPDQTDEQGCGFPTAKISTTQQVPPTSTETASTTSEKLPTTVQIWTSELFITSSTDQMSTSELLTSSSDQPTTAAAMPTKSPTAPSAQPTKPIGHATTSSVHIVVDIDADRIP